MIYHKKKQELFLPVKEMYAGMMETVWYFADGTEKTDFNFYSTTVLTCPNHHQFIEKLFDYPKKYHKERDAQGRMLLTEYYLAKCPKCGDYFIVPIQTVLDEKEANNIFNKEDDDLDELKRRNV